MTMRFSSCRFERSVHAGTLAVSAFLTAWLFWVPAAEAQTTRSETDLVVEAITLRFRSATQAIELVHPLLSGRGTVELQPGGNTLVLRDVQQAVDRIMPLLREYDQPANLVNIRVQLVSATPEVEGTQAGPRLAPAMMKRLQELLRYESYALLATAEFSVQEGLEAAYELSDSYRLDFKLGRLLEDRRISLEGFKVSRRSATEGMTPLIHTNLNLNLGRPMILGLARSESSNRALIVIVECQRGEMLLTEH